MKVKNVLKSLAEKDKRFIKIKNSYSLKRSLSSFCKFLISMQILKSNAIVIRNFLRGKTENKNYRLLLFLWASKYNKRLWKINMEVLRRSRSQEDQQRMLSDLEVDFPTTIGFHVSFQSPFSISKHFPQNYLYKMEK